MNDNRAAALVQELRAAVDDPRVLEAMTAVPREYFVPESLREQAYENVALPIAAGQTISQPLVVARMLALLDPRPGDQVLDIGTGSGYHAALLAVLCGHVWTIERHAELSTFAAEAADRAGIANISFLVGDGSEGLPAAAPFDGINVAAGTEIMPGALIAQLGRDGRLVGPEGTGQQHLVLIRRTGAGVTRERHEAVRFVPLIPGSGGR